MVFGYLILISTDLYGLFFDLFFLVWFRLGRYIKHSRQSFSTFPNTLKFTKNNSLLGVWKCGKTMSLVFGILLQITLICRNISWILRTSTITELSLNLLKGSCERIKLVRARHYFPLCRLLILLILKVVYTVCRRNTIQYNTRKKQTVMEGWKTCQFVETSKESKKIITVSS